MCSTVHSIYFSSQRKFIHTLTVLDLLVHTIILIIVQLLNDIMLRIKQFMLFIMPAKLLVIIVEDRDVFFLLNSSMLCPLKLASMVILIHNPVWHSSTASD